MHGSTDTSTVRRRLGLAATLGLVALGALTEGASAQVVVNGDARACFGTACTPLDNHRVDVNGTWFKYVSAPIYDFQGITAGGILELNSSGEGSRPGNFGYFEVGPLPTLTPVDMAFTLSLQYFNPLTPNSMFSALITGIIGWRPTHEVYAVFNPPSVTSAFQDPRSGLQGDLTVTPFNVTLPSGGSAPINGLIQVTNVTPYAVTPEPVTVVLLGTGLLGLAVVQRRRKVTDVE